MIKIPEGYKKDKNRIIPQDWDFVKIDTILEKIGERVNVEKEELYQQIGIRSHGKGLFHKELVTGRELGNKSVFWVEKDCFIVNIVFAWEQAIGRTTEKEVGMICSHRFPMYRPKESRVDIDYLVYLFKTPYGKKVLELASPGGAGRNKTLGQKEFMNSEILIPNLIEEQKKIVEILSTWDVAIEKQDQLIEKKKEFKKGLMQRLLSGEVRFKEFKDKWLKSPINKIAKIGIGKTPDRKNNNYWGTGYKWLSIGDMRSKNILNTKEEITQLAIEECNMKIVPKGTLVMSFKLTLGKVAILDDDMYTNEAICNFDVNREVINKNYLYYYLDFIDVSKFGSRATKGITLNQETLSGIIIKYPCLEEQNKIAETLISVDKEIELLEKELEALKLQKKGLMQRLLTGEVRVKV